MEKFAAKIREHLGRSQGSVPQFFHVHDSIRGRVLANYEDFKDLFTDVFDKANIAFTIEPKVSKPFVDEIGIMHLGEEHVPYIMSGLIFTFMQHGGGVSVSDSLSYLVDFFSEVASDPSKGN